MASVSLAGPAVAGENITVKVTLSLAERLIGRLKPTTEKTVLPRFACEMVTGDPPLLVKVSARLELSPSCVPPNGRVAKDGVKLLDRGAVLVLPLVLVGVIPPHPVSTAIPLASRR
jgi:hypothetical protein